jgi:hypothetical protein
MKELSIEEKAKAYDNVREKIAVRFGSNVANEIFSEYEESEDERIRKAIIDFFNEPGRKKYILNGFTVDDIIAWLEKQGEQKSDDKTEPKFKQGDWIVFNGLILCVKRVVKGHYITTSKDDITNGYDWSIDNVARLWTIQDAKDGDVLATEPIEGYHSPFVAIYKKQNEEDFDSYCFIWFDDEFYKGENGHSTEKIHPATQEQRDLLFSKMEEAGYEWDSETKKIINNND